MNKKFNILMDMKKSQEMLMKRWSGLFFMLLLSVSVFAQNITVSGTIVDVNKEPVIGATVLVKGTTNGTITDFDGNYTLLNVPAQATLSLSYIGYRSQEIAVSGRCLLYTSDAADD